MANPLTGQSSRDKDRLAEHVSVQPTDLLRDALEIFTSLFVRLVGSDSVDSATASIITATSHAAKRGNVIKFTSGTFANQYLFVADTGTDTIVLAQKLAAAPSPGDTFQVLQFRPPLVDADGHVQVDILSGGGGGSGITTGTRHASSLTAAAITAAYASLLAPGAAIRSIRIMNFTDGDIIISLDSGVTDHYALAPGKEFIENYGSNGIELTDEIEIKDGTKVSTSGAVYAIAYSV